MPSFSLDAERFPPGTRVLVGRDPDADVRLFDQRVSRRHAEIELDEHGVWQLIDLGGPHGTWVDAERVEHLAILGPVEVFFGDPHNGAPVTFEPSAPSSTSAVNPPAQSTIRIGRAADNEVRIFDLLASRYHAELRVRNGVYELVDLGSDNGSFVDGQLVDRAQLRDGQRLTFGHSSFRFRSGTVERWEQPPATTPAIDARGISVVLSDGQRILDDVSFSVAPRGFVAVVGPTGSGKSTLLRALSGVRPPEEGSVRFSGRDLYREFDELRRTIGYVPQDDILHTTLTVRRALLFASELQFPRDVTDAEREARVDEVIHELGLHDRPDTVINKLSGGQRKRTSLAIELLTRPSLLFLDEPTSGLDPGYEKSVMTNLRALADGGRAVVVVTHSIQSLNLCDDVLFLAKGGVPAFLGPVDKALAHFSRRDLADVFSDLERLGTDTPRSVPRSIPERRSERSVAPARPRAAMPRVDWARQFWTLVRRQVAVLASDRRTFAFLGAEVLIPALLILALATPGAMDPVRTKPHAAQTLLSAMAISAAAIGAANTLREIVKEVAIYRRERATVLSPSAYLASKFFVFGAITTAQVALLVVVATARAGGPMSSITGLAPRLELIFDLSLAACAAVALGLAISAVVSTSEKAMALIAVVFILQWLFSGAAVDLQDKPVVEEISYLASSNWGLAASGASIDLRKVDPTTCTTPPGEPPLPCDARWTPSATDWLISVIAMGVLTAGALALAHVALLRKDPVRPTRPRRVLL